MKQHAQHRKRGPSLSQYVRLRRNLPVMTQRHALNVCTSIGSPGTYLLGLNVNGLLARLL